MHGRPGSSQRRARVLAMAAVLMAVLFTFVAFSVDIGYIVVANAELQNAADAAALAGAATCGRDLIRPGPRAMALAADNCAANAPVTLTNTDIELGRWNDDAATFTPLAGAQEADADAVRVTCRRTSATGRPIGSVLRPDVRQA